MAVSDSWSRVEPRGWYLERGWDHVTTIVNTKGGVDNEAKRKFMLVRTVIPQMSVILLASIISIIESLEIIQILLHPSRYFDLAAHLPSALLSHRQRHTVVGLEVAIDCDHGKRSCLSPQISAKPQP